MRLPEVVETAPVRATLGGVAPKRQANVDAAIGSALSAVEMRAWRAFSEGGQLIEAMLDRRLKEAVGISHADYGVLRRLQDAEGHRMSMRDLRHEVWFSRSRLTHQVKRLSADGMVTKTDDARDRRRQLLALTPIGLENVVAAQRLVRRLLREHFFSNLPEGSVETLTATLAGMVEHLRKQPDCQAFRNS